MFSPKAKQLRLKTAHKIFYNQPHGYLQENFEKSRNRLQKHAGSSLWNVIAPNIRGNKSNTFHYNAIKDWNGLTNYMKTCENMFSQKGGRRYLKQLPTGTWRMSTHSSRISGLSIYFYT